MSHCVVDLETLDTTATAIVLSIGAVAFESDGKKLSTFYRVINVDSCIAHGMTMSGSTLSWWLKMTNDARDALTTRVTPVPLEHALASFGAWLADNGVVYMWGNDPSFDNAILQNAYARCGMKTPWLYANNRCVRTIKWLASLLEPDVDFHSELPLIAHHALHDAEAEALTVVRALTIVKAGGKNVGC